MPKWKPPRPPPGAGRRSAAALHHHRDRARMADEPRARATDIRLDVQSRCRILKGDPVGLRELGRKHRPLRRAEVPAVDVGRDDPVGEIRVGGELTYGRVEIQLGASP